MDNTRAPNITRSRWPFIVLLASMSALGGAIIHLLYRFGDTAFGYDTGLYRRYILDHFHAADTGPAIAFGLTRITTPLLHIGVPIDVIAYGFYAALCLGIVVLVYYYLSQIRDRWSGAIGSVLFATSLTWLDFIGWYYFRNLVAQFSILLALILLHRRSLLYILPVITIGIIHPISLLPMGLILIVEAVSTRHNRTWLFVTGSVSIFCIILIQYRELLQYLPILNQSLGRTPSLTTMPELTGQFVSPATFVLYSIPYLIFGILGLWRHRALIPRVVILSVVGVFLMVAQIILYRRIFIILDLCLVIGTALFLRDWYQRFPWPKTRSALVSIYAILLIARAALFVNTTTPAIPLEEVVAMQSIRLNSPTSTLLALTPATTPWLAGFTPYEIIAPGILDTNQWNETAWYEFWTTTSSDRRVHLLSQYTSSSMAIFIGSEDRDIAKALTTDPRIKQLSPVLWVYRVNNPPPH